VRGDEREVRVALLKLRHRVHKQLASAAGRGAGRQTGEYRHRHNCIQTHSNKAHAHTRTR
jgi:hypothetical protein